MEKRIEIILKIYDENNDLKEQRSINLTLDKEDKSITSPSLFLVAQKGKKEGIEVSVIGYNQSLQNSILRTLNHKNMLNQFIALCKELDIMKNKEEVHNQKTTTETILCNSINDALEKIAIETGEVFGSVFMDLIILESKRKGKSKQECFEKYRQSLDMCENYSKKDKKVLTETFEEILNSKW